MRVALTGAAGHLGRALLPGLAAAHTPVATDLAADTSMAAADVRDPEAMRALCQDAEAVIHLAGAVWDESLDAAANETRILETRIKGTCNLLQAASQAPTRRVVHISDLCILDGYADDLAVSEDFLPLPDTSAHQQSVYLSEWAAREFARQGDVEVLTLRLGTLVDAGGLPAEARYADGWLDLADAVDAVLLGLENEAATRPGAWGLYNLAADVPGSRYSLLKIQAPPLGFFPQQDFAAWRRGDGA